MNALYDGLAPVYDRWLSGDEAASPCLDFYVSYLEGMVGLVLELGVGTGRIAEALALRGVTIVGLDASMSMLRLWKTRSEKVDITGGGKPNAVCAEFERLPFAEGSFNAVTMPMRTVGHIVDAGNRLATFKEIRRILAPRGQFVLDHYQLDRKWADVHNGKDRLMYSGRLRDTEECALLIWDRYDYEFSTRTMQCTVRIEEIEPGGTLRSESTVSFPFRWFEVAELMGELSAAGLSVVSCWGDFNRTPYAATSDHMILVCS